jgi:hypothetical protein
LSSVGEFDGGPPKNVRGCRETAMAGHTGQTRSADADRSMQSNLREIQYIINLLLHAEPA